MTSAVQEETNIDQAMEGRHGVIRELAGAGRFRRR
jgi:hypothetical protein